MSEENSLHEIVREREIGAREVKTPFEVGQKVAWFDGKSWVGFFSVFSLGTPNYREVIIMHWGRKKSFFLEDGTAKGKWTSGFVTNDPDEFLRIEQVICDQKATQERILRERDEMKRSLPYRIANLSSVDAEYGSGEWSKLSSGQLETIQAWFEAVGVKI